MSEPLHVIIVGGGIGGLCLAQGLHRARVSVAVYERDRTPTDRLGGYRIHLNPAGSRSLHACLPPALWEEFVATAGEPGGLGFFTEHLEQLLVIEDHDVHGATTDPSERSHAVDRTTLRRLLLTGLDDVVHFDEAFTHEQRDGKTTAFFADGTSATGDLLVGADGAASRVRAQFLPHARPLATEAMSVASRLPLTPASRAWLSARLATSMNMIVAPDPYFLFTSAFERRERAGDAASSDSYILCAFVADPTALPVHIRDLDQPALQHQVAALVAHWHPDLHRMITDAAPDSISVQAHQTSFPVAPVDLHHGDPARRRSARHAPSRWARRQRCPARRAPAVPNAARHRTRPLDADRGPAVHRSRDARTRLRRRPPCQGHTTPRPERKPGRCRRRPRLVPHRSTDPPAAPRDPAVPTAGPRPAVGTRTDTPSAVARCRCGRRSASGNADDL